MFRIRAVEEDPPKPMLLGPEAAPKLAQQLTALLWAAGVVDGEARIRETLTAHYEGRAEISELVLDGEGRWVLRPNHDRSLRVVHRGWERENLVVEARLKSQMAGVQRQFFEPHRHSRRGRQNAIT